MNCERCVHWASAGRGMGCCRRHAPMIVPSVVPPEGELEDRMQGRWPVTFDDDWCGEFEETPGGEV